MGSTFMVRKFFTNSTICPELKEDVATKMMNYCLDNPDVELAEVFWGLEDILYEQETHPLQISVDGQVIQLLIGREEDLWFAKVDEYIAFASKDANAPLGAIERPVTKIYHN